MEEWLAALPRVLTALLLVQLFYGLIETSWPAHYYGAADLVASRVSRTWYRYLIFRFGPVLVAATIVAATGPDGLDPALASCVTFAIAHGALTSGRSLLLATIRHQLSTRQALTDVSIFIGIVLVSLIGAVVAPSVREYLPGLDKYVEVFLTGVVAAISYSYIARWTTTAEPYVPAAARLAVLPSEWLQLTAAAAARFRVDRDLAFAILLTEQRQRPDWLRLIERRFGRTRLTRTHGPFQNMTDASATDAESINAAMANLADAILPRENGYIRSTARLDYHIERHNRSNIFGEVCSSAYHDLSSDIANATDQLSLDGSPLLRVIRKKRIGADWHLFGDAGSEVSAVGGFITAGPAPRALTPSLVTTGRYHRKVWRLTLTLDDDEVTIVPYIVVEGEVENPKPGSPLAVPLF